MNIKRNNGLGKKQAELKLKVYNYFEQSFSKINNNNFISVSKIS